MGGRIPDKELVKQLVPFVPGRKVDPLFNFRLGSPGREGARIFGSQREKQQRLPGRSKQELGRIPRQIRRGMLYEVDPDGVCHRASKTSTQPRRQIASSTTFDMACLGRESVRVLNPLDGDGHEAASLKKRAEDYNDKSCRLLRTRAVCSRAPGRVWRTRCARR